MTAMTTRSMILGAAVLCLAGAVSAQPSSKQNITLSGTYHVNGASGGGTSVSMDFTATIHNTGGADLKGPIVLRHQNDMQKVWYRWSEQTIPAGGSVKINASVSVPTEEYNNWASGGPSLFFYTQNDRGDIATFQIPLSAEKKPAPIK